MSWYAKSNAYLGLLLEWWGFISLFYNFTPRLVAQIPREVTKLMGKLTGKAVRLPTPSCLCGVAAALFDDRDVGCFSLVCCVQSNAIGSARCWRGVRSPTRGALRRAGLLLQAGLRAGLDRRHNRQNSTA